MTHIDAELEQEIINNIRAALAEDIGAGDLTAKLVPAGQQARATVLVRDDALVCGLPWFCEVFAQLSADIMIDLLVSEGERVTAGSIICELRGPARPLLSGERTALNFLQTLSAVATAANEFAAAVANTRTTILDTRKTIPGLRLAQKYAVRTGGAANHRTGLYDGILIKENHIAAAGSVQAAVEAARRLGTDLPIEIEVEALDQIPEALKAGADILLLDNFDLDQLRTAVTLNRGQARLEASGGVSLDTLREIAATGVDAISVGALTKNVRAVDLSMRFI